MKRLLVLFAVLVPLSLFVAGCGKGSGQPKVLPEDSKEKKARMEQMMKEHGGLAPGMPGQGGKK